MAGYDLRWRSREACFRVRREVSCQVIGLAPAGDGTIVHLRPLPGLVVDYRAPVERALAS